MENQNDKADKSIENKKQGKDNIDKKNNEKINRGIESNKLEKINIKKEDNKREEKKRRRKY